MDSTSQYFWDKTDILFFKASFIKNNTGVNSLFIEGPI